MTACVFVSIFSQAVVFFEHAESHCAVIGERMGYAATLCVPHILGEKI